MCCNSNYTYFKIDYLGKIIPTKWDICLIVFLRLVIIWNKQILPQCILCHSFLFLQEISAFVYFKAGNVQFEGLLRKDKNDIETYVHMKEHIFNFNTSFNALIRLWSIFVWYIYITFSTKISISYKVTAKIQLKI